MSDFFSYLKALYNKDENIKYDPKKFPPYLMLLWISHDKDNFDKIIKINKFLFKINPKYIWTYLRYVLPKGYKFLKYVKKDTVIQQNEDILNELQIRYNISRLEALEYLPILKK